MTNLLLLRRVRTSAFSLLWACLAASVATAPPAVAQGSTKADPAPDTIVFSNGDTLHGKFVNEIGGKVSFHTDQLGDLTIDWSNIKELHTAGSFAVLDKSVKVRGKKGAQIPAGPLTVTDGNVAVQSKTGAAPAPISTKNAAYIVDEPTLNKEMYHEPNFFTGWNGAATAGATLVTATQNQYTVSGALGLVREVPTVNWLDPRNRTSFDFNGSFGKITQPSYLDGTGVLVPSTTTKSTIYHADAERDQYFAPRFFALAQTAFDHNYAQDLQLQQIYGGGLGWTAFKTPGQELDLKATGQYEKQEFISGAAGTNLNLVGSTFAASYVLTTKRVTFTQNLSYIPAYNTPRAYSANEIDTFAFPAYKRLSFSAGTIDSYLNDPPLSFPPTKRNSFQFTMGLSYAIKSKY